MKGGNGFVGHPIAKKNDGFILFHVELSLIV